MSKIIVDSEYHLMAFSPAITEVQATQWVAFQQKSTSGCLNKKHFGKTSIWKAVKNTVQTVN